MNTTRRAFLGNVGRGMLAASLGAGLTRELGLAGTLLEDDPDALTFGELEPLVGLMQDSSPDDLLAAVVARVDGGTPLRSIVGAAALANARTFGGEDYNGYHAFMALMPAYAMAQELRGRQRALPVLKVLYRNTDRIRQWGGRGREVLRAVEPAAADRDEALFHAMLARDSGEADRALAREASEHGAAAARDALHEQMLRDSVDVHRIVLAWRAWDTMQLTGEQHATTLLRQSVHFCVSSEAERVRRGQPEPELRELLPALMEQSAGSQPSGRKADDEWIERTALAIFGASRADGARIAAEELAGGCDPEDLGEALSLAANRLLLCDPGRADDALGKPRGSVHGASVGVHASDSANAWRHVARGANPRNRTASLIVGAYHTAGQSQYVGKSPIPYAERAEELAQLDARALLRATEACVLERDQVGACAAVSQYMHDGGDAEAMFALLRGYGISQDGALHAEKYYFTVREEFALARPAFRANHLIGLGRVTASEYSFPAPGHERSVELLNA